MSIDQKKTIHARKLKGLLKIMKLYFKIVQKSTPQKE